MSDDDARVDIAAYKVMADSAEKTSDRRQEANKFFISMNLGIAAADAFLVDNGRVNLVPLASFLGILICILWALTLWYYRDLNAAKYKILARFEKEHGVQGYDHEWNVFSTTSPFAKMGASLSTIETGLALIAIICHFFAPYLLGRLV
jgi:hypothetical protein